MGKFKFIKNGNKHQSESFLTIHNIIKAQKLASGKGVKVGIIDWGFGKLTNKIYSASFDATKKGFENQNKEHGYGMARTLKEVNANCEIYAINGIDFACLNDDELRVEYLKNAVDYAIENNIKILTYSHKGIEKNSAKKKLEKILNKAEENGIITIFIHCDLKQNIQPTKIDKVINLKTENSFNIYNYDYGMFAPNQYKKWKLSKKQDKSICLSVSSTAPVLAGIISMLLEINPNLNKTQILNILNKTVKVKKENKLEGFKIVDAYQAIELLKQKIK